VSALTTAPGSASGAPVQSDWPQRPARNSFVRMLPLRSLFAAAALVLGAAAVQAQGAAFAPAAKPSRLERFREEVAALQPLVTHDLTRRFLAATSELPRVTTRTIHRDSARTRAWSAREYAALPDSQRTRLVARELDEAFYYDTRYGTPLAYARVLEILAADGVGDVSGKRIADFGCGTLGHLRLLASLGADCTGIDVDPLLPALYSEPGDQGAVGRGRVRLVTGQWPATEAVTREVGGRYDLFLSKNTLKNGYLHPAEQVDPRMLVHLGVSDSAYVAALARTVKKGGRVLIYNLCPAPAAPGKPYIPWADGRCPFPRESWESAGFRVVAFDQDDGEAARAMAHALGWDSGANAMDLHKDLFAHYSLFVKR